MSEHTRASHPIYNFLPTENDRQHPSILQEIAHRAVVDEYVALQIQHIEKENHVLFAMADANLDTAKDNELYEAFEQLEQERIGPGKHEEFHELLHRLEHEYLG